MVNIEVCIRNGQSTTEKGKILEDLTATVLRIRQYEVVETVRITGMEIDVLAKNKINSTRIFAECKAWESPLSGDVITKLVGNVVVKDADEGWLISTGPLTKDAEGLKVEWEERTDKKRGMLSFYTTERVVSLLLDSNIIKYPNIINNDVLGGLHVSDNRTLMMTTSGMYWIVPVIDNDSAFVTSVVVFDAKTGERIIAKQHLDELKQYKNSYSEYQWMSSAQTDSKVVELLKNEYESIVQVICGDDWKDYRPARPEDFVGRKTLLSDIFNFFKNVNDETTSTRLFSVKAPSGMGKSSVVLKIDSLAKKRGYNKRYFSYCVDVRTAMSPRYVEMSIKSCFDAADKSDFTDIKERTVSFSNVSQFFEDVTIKKTLEYLREEKKCIVIIFDQFEELFSKKELYGLFENVQILCNIIDSLQGHIILGFAWKTDLAIPAEHPAYYMWSNLSDRRKEFDVSQFKTSEIKNAINVFGKQLGENVNPILSNYLTKQCQGYPWLLKKLCIHVFKLITEGNSQNAVIGQKLNIVDLFERDIDDLTPVQHLCLKEIAKSSPADYFNVAELYEDKIVQTLINDRLVIRRASKLTLYWDIFRDYVLNGTVPSLMLDYIPQQQFASIAKILCYLLENRDTATALLGKHLMINPSTIDNAMIDMVMFGVVSRSGDGIIRLTSQHEDEIVLVLQNFFKKHILYEKMLKDFKEGFSYGNFLEAFLKIYKDNNFSEKTRITYSGKLYNWFIRLGLFFEENGRSFPSIVSQQKISLKKIDNTRRKRYGLSNEGYMFWGQSSPRQVQYAYKQIVGGEHSFSHLKQKKLRNALEILVGAKVVERYNNILSIVNTEEELLKIIAASSTIQFANDQIEKKPELNSMELGELLSNRYQKNWTMSSLKRYGNAIMKWVVFLKKSNLIQSHNRKVEIEQQN